jgi:DNA-binding response OmpR family regulator
VFGAFSNDLYVGRGVRGHVAAWDMAGANSVTAEGQPEAVIRALVFTSWVTVATTIVMALSQGEFMTRTATTLEDARTLLRSWPPHLVVAETDLEGQTLLDELLRLAEGARPPVIALTRVGDLRSILLAFDKGAEDILTIPFHPAELARARALMRRVHRMEVDLSPVIESGDLRIDMLIRHVAAGERTVHLTPSEEVLLYILMANRGAVVSREDVRAAALGADHPLDGRTIDRHVHDLREKLGDTGDAPRYIETVHGQGYRFIG